MIRQSARIMSSVTLVAGLPPCGLSSVEFHPALNLITHLWTFFRSMTPPHIRIWAVHLRMFAAVHPSLVKNSVTTLYLGLQSSSYYCIHTKKNLYVMHEGMLSNDMNFRRTSTLQIWQANNHYFQYNPCIHFPHGTSKFDNHRSGSRHKRIGHLYFTL